MTTIQQIQKFLDEEGIKYEKGEGDYLYLKFKNIGNYADNNGSSYVKFFIGIDENGDYLQVVAPKLYELANCPYKTNVIELLNTISAQTKLIRWNTTTNNAINVMIDIPLNDSQLSKMQLKRCLGTILEVIDYYNDDIVNTMNTGDIKLNNQINI